jgi:2-methylcitrate dehydratase PrpD
MDPGDNATPVLAGPPAAEAIYSFSHQLPCDSVPESVLHDAKRLLLTGIAGCVMGARWPENDAILEPLAIGRDSGPCTVFGTNYTVGCADAVFLNAVHAQVHDCNDGFAGRGAWHAGRVLIPAACGVAQHARASGRDLLVALVLGYEVAHRAYIEHTRRRCDGVGASAMAAKLLALPRAQFVNGIYLADQHGPRVYPGPDNMYASANHICNAMVARTSVESVFLAKAGIKADSVGTKLYFENDLPQREDPCSFLTRQVYIKPYTACRNLHGAIDAALSFREAQGSRIEDIDKVEVHVPAGAEYVTRRLQPGDYYKIGQFSIPYTVACALLFGAVGESQFTRECIASDEVQQLQRKIVVRWRSDGTGGGCRYPTDVAITLKDGRQFSETREHARGSIEKPLTDVELIAQFNAWTGDSIDRIRKQKIVRLVLDLESLANVNDLLKLLQTT